MNINEKANGIFANFCAKLAKLDWQTAVAVPAGIGVLITFYGFGLEAHGQHELIQQGGHMALDAYKAAMQQYASSNFSGANDSLITYVRHALGGQLPSFGGNTQGIGAGVMFVAPIVSGTACLLAQSFGKIKAFVAEKEAQFANAAPSWKREARTSPAAPRASAPRG